MGQAPSTSFEASTNPFTDVQVVVGHKDRVRCLVKVNKHLIASGADDGSVVVWDSLAGSRVHSLNGHTLPITCLLAVPWGKGQEVLVSGSSDRTIRVWDITSGQCLYKLSGHNGSVTCLVQLTGSPHLVCSGGNDK